MASFKKEVVTIDDADGKITRLILNGAFQGENLSELKILSNWKVKVESRELAESWQQSTDNGQRLFNW